MLQDHKVGEMPKAPKFRKLIGPSFILLGLGLGSGEVILWPYLVANWGMGIIWGAILGITFQFFMNMEIERYALTKGESVFVGLSRKFKYFPVWFIFSTLAGFIWPGIAAASAKLIGAAFGFSNINLLAIILLVLMGVILTLGPILYKTMEKFSMILIGVGVPALFLFTLRLSHGHDWAALFNGFIGRGIGYEFLPVGIPIASFLAAFAFSGAGGNLNLAQSFYVKEKGYGMGKFGGRITSILTGKSEKLKLTGTRFLMTKENLFNFKKWWRLVNLEHLIVFWATGAFSICLLALLSYSTVYGVEDAPKGIDFVLFEAAAIGRASLPILGTFFLVLGGLMLFSTQLTVFDATSRIISENVLIMNSRWGANSLPKIYYTFLWVQIVLGCLIFLTNFTEPLLLLTIEAVINAAAMFVHIGLTMFLNLTSLEKEIRPNVFRTIAMSTAFLFFGFFTIRVILQYF